MDILSLLAQTTPPTTQPAPPPLYNFLNTFGFLILILWNLGAGLYYMLVDKGQTKRTVNALTKRIALSVALILLLILAIYMGWIEPHGVGRNPAG